MTFGAQSPKQRLSVYESFETLPDAAAMTLRRKGCNSQCCLHPRAPWASLTRSSSSRCTSTDQGDVNEVEALLGRVVKLERQPADRPHCYERQERPLPNGHASQAAHRAMVCPQVERFVAPDRRIHVRGVFYACVSAGDVLKPGGEPFLNIAENEAFISAASRYARWLGYVPFERLVDNKNDEPVVIPAPTSNDPRGRPTTLDIESLDPDALGVSAGLADFKPRQPYRLAFFGEKTSLEDVLAPLAVELSADLYLTSGHISDTHLHGMAQSAIKDGRPLVVFGADWAAKTVYVIDAARARPWRPVKTKPCGKPYP